MRRLIKKTALISVCLLIILSFALNVGAAVQVSDYVIPISGELEAECPNAVLYCDDREQYLYSKGASEMLHVSAFAKLMVGAVALELYADRLDEKVLITNELLEGSSGLVIYLEKGETLTIEQLLHATLMGGANDAATVLARLYSLNNHIFTETSLITIVDDLVHNINATSVALFIIIEIKIECQ